MREPSAERFHGATFTNRLLTWFAATRPAFLTASVLPIFVGAAFSWHQSGRLRLAVVALILLGITLIHSAANVLNDYFDARNGTDETNTRRIYPFSGGSRFIQNGILSRNKTLRFGVVLLAGALPVGTIIVAESGSVILLIGLLGMLMAVFYSAPPCLACRGLGDFSIAVCFGVLPIVGTTYVLVGNLHATAFWLGLIVGCFVVGIIWVNSIPDIDADRAAGKLTLPVRLGEHRARYGLSVMFGLGFSLTVLAPIPSACRLALVAIIPATMANQASIRGELRRAMPLTLVTHASVCIFLLLGCLAPTR